MMRPSTFRTLLLCVALVIGSVNLSLGQQSGSSSYTRPALGGGRSGRGTEYRGGIGAVRRAPTHGEGSEDGKPYDPTFELQ